ncbi:MAG TPA: protein translocase subunit SecD [Longimicrobiaceae bacterium]
MFESLKSRFILIFAFAALSVWTLVQQGVLLGLDLRGGTHLAVEILDPTNALSSEQRADAIDRALQIIRTRVDELGVAEPTIQKAGDQRILIELPGATAEDQQRAKDVIQRSAFLEFRIVRPISELQDVLPRIDRFVAQKYGTGPVTADSAEAEAAPGGIAGIFEPGGEGADSAAGAAGDSAADAAAEGTAAEDTGARASSDTAASARPFSSKLAATGGGEMLAVAVEDLPAMERYLADPEVQALLPRGTELVFGYPQAPPGEEEQFRPLYLLETEQMMTGEELEDAQAQRDPQFGYPIVTFQLSRRGGRAFERATGAHIGEQMAIVLDNRVFSAPVIQSQIGTNGQIEMQGSTIEEARDLALVLRAGALPAPITIVEERSVGPSLGADSIEQGMLAGAIGIALVVIMIVGYYRISGVMAVLALALYVLYMLGILSSLRAALTFPGIAGIVLSVGMAVDANVLIFERIREELDIGRSVRPAVNEGFKNALPAIIDSNLTTLITSLILFQFGGTGPVRGFAVTLGIGIVASMFTAIFVTRTFFMLYLERRGTSAPLSI